jgi:TRAP-type C4-dicarboxylate transport system permease small subunit
VKAVRRAIERIFEIVTVGLLIVLFVEVLAGIVFRAFRNPLVWYDEVASVLLAWLTYYGSALAALKRAHIGFPGFVRAMPRGPRMAALILRETAVTGFFLLLAWEGARILGELGGETLVTVDLPVRLTQSVIPIGSVLFIIAELINLPERIREAKGEAAPPSDVDKAAKELAH